MSNYLLFVEKLAIILLALVTFRRQFKQFTVKRDMKLKRQLLLISVGFLTYGLVTIISVSFRIFFHPLNQGVTTLIGNFASLIVLLTMVLFYLIYEP